jgi:hypothetical protein
MPLIDAPFTYVMSHGPCAVCTHEPSMLDGMVMLGMSSGCRIPNPSARLNGAAIC